MNMEKLMRLKRYIYLGFLLLLLTHCKPYGRDSDPAKDLSSDIFLPRVLFITTGITDNHSRLPQGIVVAIQSFNKKGAFVRLETRKVLYDYSRLSEFNILILSTSLDYHDADRNYSLTYMSDKEIENIKQFVIEGGILIAGDNVGRNYPDGTDRISVFQQLTNKNWGLSDCLGIGLKERNMANSNITGEIGNYFKGTFFNASNTEHWALVADTVYSNQLNVLARWENNENSTPAIIQNKYGKGTSYLLPLSGFLHPINDGGIWSADQIRDFYYYVLDEFNYDNHIRLELNPWPEGYDYAFCVTLNSGGDLAQYKRILNFLEKDNIKPVIFVNGSMNQEIRTYLEKSKVSLGSNGYSYGNFEHLKYPESLSDILLNENIWDRKFTGFRFPYTSPGYWGLIALDELGYAFESSISANNIDFIHGSVFPYNIILSHNQFYKTTEILEIAPAYHDDYYFLGSLNEGRNQGEKVLIRDVMLYREYLNNFWNYAVKPYNGLMVYLGHPQFVGYNDTTLTALENLISLVKNDNTWITSIPEVADFRKNLGQFRYYIGFENEQYTLHVVGPENITVEKTSIKLKVKPISVDAEKGKAAIIESTDGYGIVFNTINGQEIKIKI